MAVPHGNFGWVDVSLPDPGAGKDFYQSIFGWQAEEAVAPEGMPYWLFTSGGKTVAGLGPLTDDMQAQGIPPSWSSYVIVDDVEAITAKAGEMGAQVTMPPTDVMDAGRIAFLIDPTGAPIGFWQPGQTAGADLFNEPVSLSWNELATRDLPGSIDFYTALLGWKADTQDYEGFEYTMFVNNDAPIGGTYDASSVLPEGVPNHWSVYFAVADTDATITRRHRDSRAERHRLWPSRSPHRSAGGRVSGHQADTTGLIDRATGRSGPVQRLAPVASAKRP